ncbi:MAG: helix-turn-helix domain-containing protein [Bdellovibrionaceae bacterium]|nr:helix-turn-helix domain-containing protein [Pseudobdellovibrionaceae bacterium]
MSNQLKLAHTLKALMDAHGPKGIKVSELARVTGVPQATISGYLAGSGAGVNKPTHIRTLAKFFGVSMEYLLFGEDDREPTLSEIAKEELFEGWLHVTINKAIKGRRK